MSSNAGRAVAVTLFNSDPGGKDASCFRIHRDELRGVVLTGNEVAWSTTGGDFECEFFKGQEPANEIAAAFFTTLTQGEKDETWESDGEDEIWHVNGEALIA